MKNTLMIRLFAMELVTQSAAIFTLYTIMFSERGGLNQSQIGWLLAVFAVTTIIAEVPTGAIADHFSRKWSIVLAKIMLALAMASWLAYPNFAGYTAGIILMGVSEAFSSGAIQAYLYEKLGEDKKLFAHYNSRLWAVMMSGWLIGSGLATLVGPNYRTLLVLSVISPTIGAIIAMTLPSDRAEASARHLPGQHSLLRNTCEAWNYIIHSRVVLYAVLSIILMKLLVDVLIEYIPLYYHSAGTPTRYVPLLFFVGNAITIVLFWYGNRIARLLRKRELMVGTVLALVLILSSRLGTAASVLGIFWYVRFARVLFIKQEGEIQHLLIDRHRATVGSMYSMGTRLLMAVSFVLIGHFAGGGRGVVTPILIFVPLVYFFYIVIYRRARTTITAK